jgi:RimJ/RimL family protein N-acetyltransferase
MGEMKKRMPRGELPAGFVARSASVSSRSRPRAGTWNVGLLLVDPAACGRGAGTDVVGAVDDLAGADGAATLRISVDPANTSGLRFWKRLGFSPVPAVGSHPAALALERPIASAR